MEWGQARPAPGVLRSRPGRRSLGLVERVGGVRGFVGLFHPHPSPLPSRERGCCARQVPACAGMTGGSAGMTGECEGLSSCFTLTLTLSHRGRGDVAPGTAPLGSRLRGNDGRVRGFVELFHLHPNPLPSRERGCCTRHCPSGLPPTYGCHLRTGRLRRWLRRVGCLAVCAVRGLFALSTIKRGTPVVRSARLGQ